MVHYLMQTRSTNPNFNAGRLWPLNTAPMDIKVNVVAGTTPYSSVDNNTSFIT
jgi:hypothetical protein